jgi:hypothetical protein
MVRNANLSAALFFLTLAFLMAVLFGIQGCTTITVTADHNATVTVNASKRISGEVPVSAIPGM